MAAVIDHSDFGAQENEVCHCFHFFPIYLPWSDRTRCRDLSVLNVLSQLSHSPLSPSSRSFLVPLCFLPLGWYHLHIGGRLLICLPAILILACDSSSLSFCMMYSFFFLPFDCFFYYSVQKFIWTFLIIFYFYLFIYLFLLFFLSLHVFPIPIPPPTSLSTRSLQVFPS